MRKLAIALAAIALHANAAYHVVRHIPVGGAGGWDYLAVDSAGHRLFVSHGDRVEVVDLESGKTTASITGLSGVHGIALAPDLGRGYITSGRSNTLTIFDLKSLRSIKDVKTTGDNPDAVLYDPFMKRIWTFNGRGHNATVLDADGSVLATVALSGKPEFAQSDKRGRVFVNIEDKNEIAVVDAKAMRVEKTFALAPGCDSPSGLAIDRDRNRLYTVCENKVMEVVNDDSGAIVGSAAIGGGVDGAALDAKRQIAFASNGADGTVTVVDAKSGNVIGNIPTARGARTIALDETTGHIFVSTARFGETPHPRPAIIEGTFEVIELAP